MLSNELASLGALCWNRPRRMLGHIRKTQTAPTSDVGSHRTHHFNISAGSNVYFVQTGQLNHRDLSSPRSLPCHDGPAHD